MAEACWWLIKIVREQAAEIRRLKARLALLDAQAAERGAGRQSV